jgi:GT2 family glycosyltransferase/lipopolysaccharide/colanic/teichoic acid biosynthesis glycosyltransferase
MEVASAGPLLQRHVRELFVSEVSVIVVNYRTEEYLPACLESLKKSSASATIEPILVDNSKGRGAAEILRQHFPEGKLIENDRNLGYAEAVNQGLSASDSEFIFIVNPDTVAKEGSLDGLAEFMKTHPDAGIVGPKLVNPDGTIQLSCRRFYTFKTILLRRTFLGKIFGNNPSVKRHLMLEWDHNSAREVDWITGAAMMVRKAAVSEVGPMDERFFLYFEDVDWCYRMRSFGWKVYYYPFSELVHHYKRQSAEAGFGKAKRAHLESWLRFYEKWSLLLYLVKRNRELVSRIVLLAADVAAVSLAFYLSYLARANLDFILKKPTPPFEVYGQFMALAVIVGIGSTAYVGLYGRRKIVDWIDLLFDVSKAMVLTSVIVMASTFLLYVKIYSRAAVLMFLPISILVLTGERFLFWLAQRKLALTKVNVRRILIVGSGSVAQRAKGAVLKGAKDGLELAGFLDTSVWSPEESNNLWEVSERIREAAHIQRAGEIVLADSPSHIETIWPALSELRGRGLGVALATELGGILTEGDRIEEMGDLGFVSLKKRAAPGGVTKRVIEFVLALLALIVLAMPVLVTALYLVGSRRKPVFVRQDMLGEHGETVTVRFLNCSGASVSRKSNNMIGGAKDGVKGLCAAPLLLSVLAGQLALVGVRPRFKSQVQETQSQPGGKPGVFGMWKLAESPEEMDSKDSEYLAGWSVSLDLRTIARCILHRHPLP